MIASPERVCEVNSLLALCNAVVDAVAAGGSDGTPGGLLYAAMSANGCTLNQYEIIMDALCQAGRLRKGGQLYFLALSFAARSCQFGH